MDETSSPFLSTGIPGLDHILGGGFIPDRLYLLEGEPGAGKTTAGLQFLLAGARDREPVVYITLAETRHELEMVARSHGWSLSGIHVHEVLPSEEVLAAEEQYSMFHPTEVEMADRIKDILAVVEARKPRRLVLDSLSELQLLADSPLRYRRQVLALKQFFARRECTVLLLDDRSAQLGDPQVRSIAHGVIQLDDQVRDYGTERRRLRIVKHRGSEVVGGLHDYSLARGGIQVYPRLVAASSRGTSSRRALGSGLAELDEMLGGGVEAGTSTLIAGPPGAGKSSLAVRFVRAACDRGEAAAMFLFEDSIDSMLGRADGLNQSLRHGLDSGLLTVQQIDPAELSPGQFAATLRKAVQRGVTIVVIDSLNGYLNAVPDERFLTTYLRELLTFLAQHGVMTILVGVQQGMVGGGMTSAMDASYIADNVLMLRYFEDNGEIRQAVSVFKKRGGAHERSIRAFSMSAAGLQVGQVLRGYRGLLTGVPVATNDRRAPGERSGEAG